MCNVTYNEEKNGIELRFDNKPLREVIDTIKAAGFHWSNRQKMWYAKKTDERIKLVETLTDETTNTEKVITDAIFDLWGLTRVDNIEKHPEENLDTKSAAALIRKHFRTRFPMFKFSVTSDFNSIDAYITSSPYEKDSKEVAAVLEYMGYYIDSYKANTRYDFYGGKNYPRTTYDCTFTEMTVSDLNVRNKFQEEEKKWEAAEEIRREKEFQEYLIQQEKDKIEYEKREAIRNANHEKIVAGVEVKDVESYFMHELIESWRSKEDCLDKYYDYKEDDEEPRRTIAEVTREIYMDKETYELFKNQLLDDYSFLEGMGGSNTMDKRINSMNDYSAMIENERDTVKWYSTNCIAVYCNNELKFIIDPQGYSYARYCFIFDKETYRTENMEAEQAFTDEEFDNFKANAETIEDVSTEIIEKYNWKDTWNTDNQLEYIDEMVQWIYDNNFKIKKEIVQQIEIEDLKTMMYRVLRQVECITEQFVRANLVPGQKITIMRIGDMGGFSVSKVQFESLEIGKYAQYDKAVKLVFKPERKRKLYYNWFYRDMIVLDGWVDIPETVLWDIDDSSPFITTKKSKFLSCDRGMYDAVENYLDNQDIIPIINTYNPSNRK